MEKNCLLPGLPQGLQICITSTMFITRRTHTTAIDTCPWTENASSKMTKDTNGKVGSTARILRQEVDFIRLLPALNSRK